MEYEEGVVPSFTRSETIPLRRGAGDPGVVTDPILADGEGNRVATMSFEIGQRIGGWGWEPDG